MKNYVIGNFIKFIIILQIKTIHYIKFNYTTPSRILFSEIVLKTQ